VAVSTGHINYVWTAALRTQLLRATLGIRLVHLGQCFKMESTGQISAI